MNICHVRRIRSLVINLKVGIIHIMLQGADIKHFNLVIRLPAPVSNLHCETPYTSSFGTVVNTTLAIRNIKFMLHFR